MEANATHPRRPALGKGIESLLGPRPQAAPVADATGKPLEIALDRIDRNPHQTRTAFDEAKLAELAQSIAATGVVQPVVVREIPGGRYQLIMGERRWRASQAAGKATIPAIVRQVSDEQSLEMTIVENLQREDLNAMEPERSLLALGSAEQMAVVANRIASQAMSVRQTETYVQGLINPEPKPKKQLAAAAPLDPNVREAQDRLQR